MEKTTAKIMVVDDDASILSLIAHVLRSLGYSCVTEWDSGLAALESMQSAPPPDLILLDLNMPGMDGVEFAKRLVEQRFSGRLVLISGEDARVLRTVESLIRGLNITVAGHLKKPFLRASVSAIMEHAMRYAADASPPLKRYDPDSIRAAISEGQLVNFYQPIVEVATGELVGTEALVRWQHPEDGLAFPDQFVGVAEQHRLIDPLSRLVVQNAFAEAREWRAAGRALTIAVNLSMENLSLDFVDFITREATRAGIAPPDITLEVTHNRLMQDPRAALEVLARLRMKRFRLSLDDFGNGHASLRRLRDMPFDELKIDRGFVQGARQDPTAKVIYDASVALGKQLGMKIVAEGVETLQDWTMLQRTHCDFAQGYFIGRPMSAEDLGVWMEEWEVRRNSLLGSPCWQNASTPNCTA